MELTISNEITIHDSTPEVRQWIYDKLKVPNPEYANKVRLGLWLGSTPKELKLYRVSGNSIIIPYGVRNSLFHAFPELNTYEHKCVFATNKPVNYNASIKLYDYQENAVQSLVRASGGILQSKAGSGKTRMGIALICALGKKTLWLTHTNELLNQSYNAAAEFIDKKLLGKITAGKIQIADGITFATVQTLCKADLQALRYEWDMIVVDECFSCDTLISTIDGYKKIKDIDYGDMVLSYNHETCKAEYKPVIYKFCKGAENILTVTTEFGRMVLTGNHPVYTQRGYIKAEELTNGDYVLQDMSETCRFIEKAEGDCKAKQIKGLRFLFERLRSKITVDGRKKKKGFRTDERAEQDRSIYKAKTVNENKQPYEQTRDKGEGIKDIKRTRSQTAYKGWKWNRTYRTTENVNGCIDGIRNDSRICSTNKEKTRGLSYLLQDRRSNSKQNDSNRNRRKFALLAKKTRTGQEENRLFKWVRVESVEVQEQTSDGTFNGLCADGNVYNIGVEDNHNYFANDILVHNCHRCAGTVNQATMFSKVLNNLAAPYKYGLTATPHRADGLIKCTYSLLGGVSHKVPDECANTMKVKIQKKDTGIQKNRKCLDTDGTLVYARLINYLALNSERNAIIARDIYELRKVGHSILLLTDRIEQLELLRDSLDDKYELGYDTVILHGSIKAEYREKALEQMRNKEKHILLATYQLAKEGLDVPCLDRLLLATPVKDYAIVVQSVGRIARVCDGKGEPVVYDYVDDIGFLQGMWKKRCTHYRKDGCIL